MHDRKTIKNCLSSSVKKKKLVLIALLLVINIGLYLQVLSYDFLKDDYRLIVENPRIKTFQAFKQSIGGKFFSFPDFPYLHYWRPLSLFSFYLDFQLWGLNPTGYHLFNLLLNTLNTVLVFWFFWVLTEKLSYAFVTALFYSLHPARVEASAWISGRTDLLSAFFLLSATLAFILFLKKQKTRYYILTFLAFLLALLSKENGILFPLLAGFLVLCNWNSNETSRSTLNQRFRLYWRKWAWTLPFWFIDAVYVIFHNKFSAVGGVIAGFSFSHIPVMIKTIGAYVRIILLPFFPTPHFSMSYFDHHTMEYTAFFIVALLLLAWLFKKRTYYRYTLFSLLFFIFLLPVLDPEIVPSYPKIVLRFAYIPALLAGIFFWESFLLLQNKRLKQVFTGLLIFIGLVWTVETFQFQQYYQDQHAHYNGLLTYFQDDASLLLPAALMKASDGEIPEALKLVNQALEINHLDPWLDMSEMGSLLKANLLIASGQTEHGRILAEKILSQTEKDDMKYFGNMILAKYYEKRGAFNRALSLLKKAQSIGETPDLLFRIALVYGQLQDFPNALNYINAAIQQTPQTKKYQEFKEFLIQQMNLNSQRGKQ